MFRRLSGVVAVVALASMPSFADEADVAKKLKGSWEREINGTKVTFEFKKEKAMRILVLPQGADNAIEVDVDYTITKDNVLKGEISAIEKRGVDNLPDKGTKFSFKIEIGAEKIITSDFSGVEGQEAKQLIEGDYSKKK